MPSEGPYCTTYERVLNPVGNALECLLPRILEGPDVRQVCQRKGLLYRKCRTQKLPAAACGCLRPRLCQHAVGLGNRRDQCAIEPMPNEPIETGGQNVQVYTLKQVYSVRAICFYIKTHITN